MHFEKEQLALDGKDDVRIANEAHALAARTVFAEDESVLSTPFTRGGEFPKILSPNATKVVLDGIRIATEFDADVPIDQDFLNLAHVAVDAAYDEAYQK